jgi:hypothetical protein
MGASKATLKALVWIPINGCTHLTGRFASHDTLNKDSKCPGAINPAEAGTVTIRGQVAHGDKGRKGRAAAEAAAIHQTSKISSGVDRIA